MAHTIRAASKRAHSPRNVDAPQPADAQHCRLLELPPELRNRIYELAAEEPHLTFASASYAPRARKCSPKVSWAQRVWQFYGLTQSCQQLRSEYRPLWIHDLSVRLTPSNFADFVAAFLPITEKRQPHGPELIQISWNHGIDGLHLLQEDIMPFLLLHARFTNVWFEYVPYGLADLKREPRTELCKHCCEVTDMEEGGSDPEDTEGYCTCFEQDMDFLELIMKEEDQMRYTDILKDFLQNDNQKWLADLTTNQMTVKCKLDRNTDLPTYRIFCAKQPMRSAATAFEDVYNLLESWGVFDLRLSRSMEFVVAYEAKSKKKIGNYEMTQTMVREIHVPRRHALPRRALLM